MSCKHTTPCGCEDKGYTTNSPCSQDLPVCERPEKCSETFSDECIIHTGDTIVDLDIKKGDRLSTILQKLVLMLTNEGCIEPAATCKSPLGVGTINIYSTSIKLGWDAVENATNYEVQYKTAAALVWSVNLPIAATDYPTDTIGGLLPNTTYHIRVRSICGVETCTSVTIEVKTKS